MSQTFLFIVLRGLKIQMRSIWICANFLVTREVWLGFFLWHLLNLHLHLLFMSHGRCSGRLTWDVFARDLARQLGTPSLWLLVDSCKEGQRGALAAVCTPTLKSASKKHQKHCTSVSEHREWHSKGGKRSCVLCISSRSGKQSFPSPLCVTSRLEQATRVSLENLPKVRTPFYLNYSSI